MLARSADIAYHFEVRTEISNFGRERGFALISTLMLLVLVVLVVVAMLGMARQETRASVQVKLRAQAQGNARLAVELALARLQEELGPDTRAAAPASIADDSPETEEAEGIAAPWMCGVWESWRMDPHAGGTPDYAAEKSSRFSRWLISEPDPDLVKDLDFPKALPFSGETVELVGAGSLGKDVADDDTARVRAGLVEVTPEDPTARESGRLAWVCLDENTKARADLPGDNGAVAGSAGDQASLLAGSPRFGIDSLDGLEMLPATPEERGRALTLDSLEAMADVEEGNRGSWFHDLTTWSSGFHADVVGGGLKKDLSLMFSSRGLPAGYGRSFVLNSPVNRVRWEYLQDYCNLWRHVDAENGYRISAIPPAVNPADSAPVQGVTHPVLPVVARMQFACSFYARYHGGWNTWYPGWKHLLFFFMDPVVTLWNPYNVPLEFEEFHLTCYQLPISFRYRQNGTDVSGGWVHFLEQWYPGAANHAGGNAGGLKEKSYKILIKPESSGMITLQPGEVRLFSSRGIHWDWANQTTSSIVTLPGFESDGGFALDWVAPRWTRVLFVNPNEAPPDTMSVSVRADETKPYNGWDFYADFEIKQSGTLHPAGGVRIRYPGKLADYLIDPERYPGQILEAQRDTPEIVLSDVNAYRKWPFCLFSVQLRSEQDARFPGRMWDHENPLTPFSSTPPGVFEHPANHLYELDLKPMASWQDIPTIDATPEGNSFFGPGEFSDKGISFATHSGIPIAPPTSLTDLRHANLSHASVGARQSHVIGNSRAHPRIPSGQVIAGDDIDYRYLMNDALWDSAYFSGLSPQPAGAFPSEKTRREVIEEFVAGDDVLPDPRYVRHDAALPDADVVTELDGSDGFEKAAAHQMVAGMFNVNSTSVKAWEALLGGLSGRELQVLAPAAGGVAADGASEGVPVSRTALPNRTAVENAVGGFWDREDSKWLGYRRLSTEEVRALAGKIVGEVKKRGPFLSLSEFINRRVGADPELSKTGAVDAAIDATALNGPPFDPTSVMIDAAMAGASLFPNPAAALGHSGAGAPGFICQADVLSPVSNVLTVRSDTFRIRAYGDVLGRDGEVRSRAWCEAVVQRVPDYVDPADAAYAEPAAADNVKFGRRFRIVHFRWLSPDEV